MNQRQTRQFIQQFFCLHQHPFFEAYFFHSWKTLVLIFLTPTIQRHLLAAEGLQHPEALEEFFEAFFGVDDGEGMFSDLGHDGTAL